MKIKDETASSFKILPSSDLNLKPLTRIKVHSCLFRNPGQSLADLPNFLSNLTVQGMGGGLQGKDSVA